MTEPTPTTEPRTLCEAINEAARIEASRTHGYRGLRSQESWSGKEYRVREKITRSAFRRLMQIRRLYRAEAARPVPLDVERLAEALEPVTRAAWSTEPKESQEQWRSRTAAAIAAEYARLEGAEHD